MSTHPMYGGTANSTTYSIPWTTASASANQTFSVRIPIVSGDKPVWAGKSKGKPVVRFRLNSMEEGKPYPVKFKGIKYVVIRSGKAVDLYQIIHPPPKKAKKKK